MKNQIPLQSNANSTFPKAGSSPLRVAVVGAGCTGLRIATLCEKMNRNGDSRHALECIVFEARSAAGGYLQSQRLPSGHIVDHGAQGVLSSRDAFLRALEDLNLTPQDVIAPRSMRQHRTRYLLNPRGGMAALTLNPWHLWKNELLRPAQWLRALLEVFWLKPAQPPSRNETLYRFIERHFGHACAENFILPFATGIWGGASEKLLVRHAFPQFPEREAKHGSLLRSALLSALGKVFTFRRQVSHVRQSWPRGLLSFRGGMKEFIAHMLKQFEDPKSRTRLSLESPVTRIKALPDGKLLINNKELFDAVFWTSQPWQTPELKLEPDEAQRDWQMLQNTPTHDLIVVHVSGKKDSSTKDGFGVLAGRSSDGLLGVLFVHSIYQEHCQEGQYAYRVLLGGDRNTALGDWSEEELKNYTLLQLRKIHLLSENSDVANVRLVRWSRAVGIADENHDARLAALWRIEALLPGLHFAGNYKKGVGVADALQSAQEAFDQWLSALPPNH